MLFTERDTRFARSRILVLQWIIIVSFVVLGTGFWRLQIFEAEYYAQLSEHNHLKDIPVAAPRGRILDRYNRVMVDNYPSFTIMAQWEFLKNLQEHVAPIAQGLGIDPAELAKEIETSRRRTLINP